MMHEFPAPHPAQLYVELRSAEVVVEAAEFDKVTVRLSGSRADDVVVRADSGRVHVVEPRRTGFLSGRGDLVVELTVPTASELVAKLGAANVRATGALGAVRISNGAGDVRLDVVMGESTIKTGAGDVTVGSVEAEGEIKAGAGVISVGRAAAPMVLKTGAGSIEVSEASAPLMLKSGSGNLSVGSTDQDTTVSAASGDIRVGRMSSGQANLKNVSGNIRLGIPGGTPVWTDVSTSTGRVVSTLTPTGAPAYGQPYVEVRARSLSGDIHLERL